MYLKNFGLKKILALKKFVSPTGFEPATFQLPSRAPYHQANASNALAFTTTGQSASR